ncbi:MAG: cobalamin B12-binding domain-containing protein, partial [Thermoleophilia bacterium]
MNKKNSITLVFPRLRRESNVWAPLPLQAVAAPLIDAGFDVSLIDCRVIHPHIPDIIKAARDSLFVGLSVMTGLQIRDAVVISKAVKEAFPDIPVVWGGYHASMLPEQTLAESFVD